MKFVVPLTMPAISLMTLAAMHWCMGVMMGVPPPTLASNRKHTPLRRAMASSSAPWVATSSLLEVTTWRPLSSADFT